MGWGLEKGGREEVADRLFIRNKAKLLEENTFDKRKQRTRNQNKKSSASASNCCELVAPGSFCSPALTHKPRVLGDRAEVFSLAAQEG